MQKKLQIDTEWTQHKIKPLKRFVFKGFLVRDEGLEPPRSPART